MIDAPEQSAEWYRYHYIEQNRTAKEIGDMVGLSKHQTLRRLRSLGISKVVNGKWVVKKRRGYGRKVIAYFKDGKTVAARYDTIDDAAKATGSDKGSIWNAANGRRKTAAGYIWKYDLTHGEEYFRRRNAIDFRQGDADSIAHKVGAPLPKRMSREEAGLYYGEKIKKYFRRS